MATRVYPGTSVSITITVTKVSDGTAVDVTTLALTITPPGGGTVTTKAVGDLTHGSTGIYSYVHRFPLTTVSGTAYIYAACDAAIDATAIASETSVSIQSANTSLS